MESEIGVWGSVPDNFDSSKIDKIEIRHVELERANQNKAIETMFENAKLRDAAKPEKKEVIDYR